MSEHREIRYAASSGERGVGDLFLPDGVVSGCPVLLIHGGGWRALAKESFEFLVPFFLQEGRPVFNINYRLLGTAPWPACGNDCLAAARFLCGGGLADFGVPAQEKILICGASAGGHLAMMTGLRLPRENVEAILSLAGPSRLDWLAANRDPVGLNENFFRDFFGHPVASDSAEARDASPALRDEKNPPPLFCLHSSNDRLAPLQHSEEARTVWQAGGGRAEVTSLNGDGELHGFWVADDRDRLRPEVGEFIKYVLNHLP